MAGEIDIQGHVAPGLEPVREVFCRNFEEGRELGASFAVFRTGEPIVDLWAGHCDRAQSKPWRRDSLINVWSTTKGMAALCCALLVDRGLLDYGARVARYWPEFAAHGKQDVTVGMLLSHQAGLSAPRERVETEIFYQPEKINALLLDQEPLFEPGSTSGYHAMTFGPLVGELVRRVAGESLGSFFRREVALPLEADFYIGLPESEEGRVAELIGPPSTGPDLSDMGAPSEVRRLTFSNPINHPEIPNQRAWRAAEIPSANGHGTASALAKIYSVLANGGEARGVRLVGEATLDQASTCQCEGEDLVLPVPLHWGCGFILNNLRVIYGPNPEAYGHSGYGGSFGYADPATNIGVGYTMNKMSVDLAGDPRTLRLVQALHSS